MQAPFVRNGEMAKGLNAKDAKDAKDANVGYLVFFNHPDVSGFRFAQHTDFHRYD